MKQIQYIIASLLTLLSISSCEVETGVDVTNQRTLAGKYIFDEVDQILGSYISRQAEALRFDAYLQADEDEKKRILKSLLSGYKFKEKGDTVCFYTKYGQWSILRASTDSLTSPSASWSMRFFDIGSNVETVPFGCLNIMRNEIGDGWIMDLKDLDNNIIGEGTFEIKKLTEHKLHPSKLMDEYSITTVGETAAFIQNWKGLDGDSICIKYQVTKPFHWKHIETNSRINFIEGRVEMDVVGGVSEEKKHHVSAEIEQRNYDFVTIQFKGITELLPQENPVIVGGIGSGGGYGDGSY